VAPASVTKTFALTSFSEDMRNRGMEPDSVIIGSGLVAAGARVGQHLGISPSEEVVRLERLRTADGVPMCIERVYLPAHLVPGILDEDLGRSLYDLLERRYKIRAEEAEQSVRSTVLQPREARLLEVPPLSPALLVERTTFDRRARRVERATSIYRGDRYSYQLRIRRVDPEDTTR
jgi:GntR family transcriptional regulator